MLRRVAVAAMAALLVVAVTVIVWSSVRLGDEVNLVRSRQVKFHNDTIASNTALTKATASNLCESAALNAILTELAAAQSAVAHHRPPTAFVYPKPC